MPKVTDEHRRIMRRRIQDAALACFARKGFAGASMADIVKEADLSAGAVYVYYSSKSELTVDVGRRIMEQRISALEDFGSAEEVPPPGVVFPKLLASLLDDNPFAPLVLQVWGEAAHAKDFAAIAATIFDSLIGHFEDYLFAYFHRSQGKVEHAARARAAQIAPAILAMMQGSIVQTSIFGEGSQQRVADAIAALLLTLES